MLHSIARWLHRGRERRRRWKVDAAELMTAHCHVAYDEAQRRVAQARVLADGQFLHWAKVAAEIARIDPEAEMDVQVLIDREYRQR